MAQQNWVKLLRNYIATPKDKNQLHPTHDQSQLSSRCQDTGVVSRCGREYAKTSLSISVLGKPVERVRQLLRRVQHLAEAVVVWEHEQPAEDNNQQKSIYFIW